MADRVNGEQHGRGETMKTNEQMELPFVWNEPVLAEDCESCDGTGEICDLCGDSRGGCGCGSRSFHVCIECDGRGTVRHG